MRSTLLVGAVAVGQVAALNGKHASFHARRNAKPEVDYNGVNYDSVNWSSALADIDWATVKYDGGSAPTAAPSATTPAAAAAAAPTSYAESNPKPSSEEKKKKPDATTSAPPAKTSESKDLGDLVEDMIEDVTELAKTVGLGKGVNSREPNGEIWIGNTGSDFQITFSNEGAQNTGVICWNKADMFTVKDSSLIFTNIKPGKSLTVSLAKGFSGGCAPIYKDSKCSFSGIIDDSILEFTAEKAQYGVYQISREVNMNGHVINASGSRGCISGVKNNKLACIFGCADGADTCGERDSYNLITGSDDSGFCQTGEFGGQPEGGCQFGEEGDHIQVTFSDSKDWPAEVFPKYAGEYANK